VANLTQFEFVWWWCLLLLPLPYLVMRFAPPVTTGQAISLPYLPESSHSDAPSNLFNKVLVSVIWILLVIATARPVWYGDPIENQPQHRDLMLVVDLSGSMETRDMQNQGDYIDRLSAVKQVLSGFISRRKGDRLGLVLFADNAYLQTPLTLDRTTVLQQLNQTTLGLIGEKTAIGEGIGLATKVFVDSDAPQRIMVLLSDGTNTAGVLDPIKAAEIAKKYQATIYTVGVGAGELVVKDFLFSRTVNTAKDLDEQTLTRIAEITGGKYFRARNQQELDDIYQAIDKLEPVSEVTEIWRPQDEWFPYPLAAALILSLLLTVQRQFYG